MEKILLDTIIICENVHKEMETLSKNMDKKYEEVREAKNGQDELVEIREKYETIKFKVESIDQKLKDLTCGKVNGKSNQDYVYYKVKNKTIFNPKVCDFCKKCIFKSYFVYILKKKIIICKKCSNNVENEYIRLYLNNK